MSNIFDRALYFLTISPVLMSCLHEVFLSSLATVTQLLTTFARFQGTYTLWPRRNSLALKLLKRTHVLPKSNVQNTGLQPRAL